MFKNFHWGHGITIFYVIFVAVVVSVLIASFGVDHSLVADDYYAKDLAYQERYDKTQNVIQSGENKITINVLSAQEILEIIIDSDMPVVGKAYFYRPSDESQDMTIDITTLSTTLSTAEMLKGKWIVKVEWKEGTTPYYQETQIYIA